MFEDPAGASYPLASELPYMEVSGLLSADGIPPAERHNLLMLDRKLHTAWGLGANVILNWSAGTSAIDVLLVPHYAVAACASDEAELTGGDGLPVSADFVRTLISGRRHLTPERLAQVARLLSVEPVRLHLSQPLSGNDRERLIIEQMIKRYSISYVANRAVALFDIVHFSLLSPFEQMIQLNSLCHSINAAHSRMLERHIGVNFARSSTGDGFYLWNRDAGLEANTNLYHFMHLVLADNAIARRKNRAKSVPLLRAGFHVGGCYEFYQAERLKPTLYNYIVGDVTIELARMIERALPEQIIVGEFSAAPRADEENQGQETPLDAIEFIRAAQHNLTKLNGLELAGERIEAIKCYLTGEPIADGAYNVRRLTIADKHGVPHNLFNAKVNIYRRNAGPILLGLEDHVIADSALRTYSSLLPPDAQQQPPG